MYCFSTGREVDPEFFIQVHDFYGETHQHCDQCLKSIGSNVFDESHGPTKDKTFAQIKQEFKQSAK